MAKEDVTDKGNASLTATGGEPKQTTQPDPRDTEIQQLKQERDASNRKLTEVQGMLLSPEYQEQVRVRNQPMPTSHQATYGAPSKDDIETMDNTQLVTYMTDAVSKLIDQKVGAVNTQLTGLSRERVKDKIADGIKSTRKRYKSFDNFKTAMIDAAARIRKEGPNAEDIYKIASWQEPGQAPVQQSVSSEKPTSTSAAPPSTEKLDMRDRIAKLYDEKVGK